MNNGVQHTTSSAPQPPFHYTHPVASAPAAPVYYQPQPVSYYNGYQSHQTVAAPTPVNVYPPQPAPVAQPYALYLYVQQQIQAQP